MLQLDINWLAAQGVTGLSDADAQSLLQYVYGELEMRVGMKLSENLTDEQLRQFEQLANAGDEQQQLQWLETNCPNYKQVVQQQLEQLGAELRQHRDQILMALQQQQQQMQQQMPPAPGQFQGHPGQQAGPMPMQQPQAPQPPQPQDYPQYPQQPAA